MTPNALCRRSVIAPSVDELREQISTMRALESMHSTADSDAGKDLNGFVVIDEGSIVLANPTRSMLRSVELRAEAGSGDAGPTSNEGGKL